MNVTVKSLEFRKEMRVWEVAVYNADRVVRIQGGDKSVGSILDGLHVPWSNVASRTDKSKILQAVISLGPNDFFNGFAVYTARIDDQGR